MKNLSAYLKFEVIEHYLASALVLSSANIVNKMANSQYTEANNMFITGKITKNTSAGIKLTIIPISKYLSIFFFFSFFSIGILCMSNIMVNVIYAK